MENLIIWKDAVEGTTSYSTELGRAFEIFKGCKTFIVAKDNGKKAVIMFKNPEGKVATVIMQASVDKGFRDKTFSLSEALSFPVVRMEKLLDREGNVITEEPTLWLGKPGQGWKDIVSEKVKIVEDYEELAG